MNYYRRLPQVGFTLTEVAMAIALLSIFVVFVLGLLPSSIRLGARASVETQADSLLEAELERCRGRDPAILASATLPDVQLKEATFRLERTVSDIAGEDPKYLKSVKVTVIWSDRTGEHRRQQEINVARMLR